jgi:hypothetical protein
VFIPPSEQHAMEGQNRPRLKALLNRKSHSNLAPPL